MSQTDQSIAERVRDREAGMRALLEAVDEDVDSGKFDNRPDWDNNTGGWDSRPTWDNWDKRKK